MEWFGLTDRGRVRPTNQDIYQIQIQESQQTALLLVCDGMGGVNAGNIASRLAAESFMEKMKPLLEESHTMPIDESVRQAALMQALDYANHRVYSLSLQREELRGMGTTLVAVFIQTNQATIVNVGDSRAYLLEQDDLRQVTEDHSLVQEMCRMGRISVKDARTHPQKNLITRAVGVDAEVQGDFFEVQLVPSSILLLCSDGLSGMVEDEQIAETLQSQDTLETIGETLLQQALTAGGRDNITVALFRQGREV